jgi:hypothetical protein
MIPSTLQEARAFDERLTAYVRFRNQVPVERWTIFAAFELCELRFDRAIFPALVDLKVNTTLVSCDITEAYQTWKDLAATEQAGHNALHFDDAFIQRMRIHDLLSGVAFRYRALWDKFFELILRLGLKPRLTREEADKIIEESGITEGKKNLRRLLRETPMNPQNIIRVHKYLTYFDQHYRTPEAHQMGGRMFRWTMVSASLDDTPLPEFMLNAWNLWNNVESLFELMFSEQALTLARNEYSQGAAKGSNPDG